MSSTKRIRMASSCHLLSLLSLPSALSSVSDHNILPIVPSALVERVPITIISMVLGLLDMQELSYMYYLSHSQRRMIHQYLQSSRTINCDRVITAEEKQHPMYITWFHRLMVLLTIPTQVQEFTVPCNLFMSPPLRAQFMTEIIAFIRRNNTTLRTINLPFITSIEGTEMEAILPIISDCPLLEVITFGNPIPLAYYYEEIQNLKSKCKHLKYIEFDFGRSGYQAQHANIFDTSSISSLVLKSVKTKTITCLTSLKDKLSNLTLLQIECEQLIGEKQTSNIILAMSELLKMTPSLKKLLLNLQQWNNKPLNPRKCSVDDVVWNLPSVTTLHLLLSKDVPRIVAPMLKTTRFSGVRRRDLVRIMNDLQHVDTISIDSISDGIDVGRDGELFPTNVPLLATRFSYSDDKLDLTSHPYKFRLLQSICSQLTCVTTVHIEYFTFVSYEVLGNLFQSWPQIVKIIIAQCRLPNDAVDDILSAPSSSPASSSLSPSCIIDLPHLTYLELFGWNQHLIDRLRCPQLEILSVDDGMSDPHHDEIRCSSNPVDITHFLYRSRKLMSLSLSDPFRFIPSYTDTLPPTLEHISITSLMTDDDSISSLLIQSSAHLTRLVVYMMWSRTMLRTLESSMYPRMKYIRLSILQVHKFGRVDNNDIIKCRPSDVNFMIRMIGRCPELSQFKIKSTNPLSYPLICEQVTNILSNPLNHHTLTNSSHTIPVVEFVNA